MEKNNDGTDVFTILIIAVVIIAILTWAVSTFFGIIFTKALAGVILSVFLIIVVLFACGLGV